MGLARVLMLGAFVLAAALPTGGAAAAVSPVSIGEPDGQGAAFRYDPQQIDVAVGDTVTWTNLGALIHTITADDGSFDSGIVEIGAQFSFTPTAAGVIAYHCRVHPMQRGTIVVQDTPAG